MIVLMATTKLFLLRSEVATHTKQKDQGERRGKESGRAMDRSRLRVDRQGKSWVKK